MRLLLSNKTFIVIMAVTASSTGYFNALITQMQQFLCSRNYENWLTGAVTASFMVSGFVGGLIQARGLRCYPLRVAFLRISGLLESLDCPSDWFVGVAEEGAMPKNQLEEPD